jgi:hypothetical protein
VDLEKEETAFTCGGTLYHKPPPYIVKKESEKNKKDV